MRERRLGWWLVVLAAVALVVPSRMAVPVVALVLLVVGAGRWWVRRSARSLQVRCAVPEWASYDQPVEAVVEIRNRSRLPAPWVEVDVPAALALGRTSPHREALMLPPLGTVVRRVPLHCLQRGRHHVGPPRLRVGDVLGVTTATPDPVERSPITVFPRIVPLDRLGLPAQSPFVTVPSRRSLLVDPTAVAGVRDYRPGDPFSAIHWTATARTDRLVVKQYERAEARDTLVCLDLSPRGYPRGALRPAVELAITVAASVLHHSVLVQRLPAGLVTAAWSPAADQAVINLPPRSDEGHLRRMLEVLALAEAGAPTPLAQVLADIGRLPPGTTVLAITGKLDATTAANLLRLSRQGTPVALALTGPSADEDALDVAGLWLPVYRISDLPAVTGLAA